MTPEEEQLLEKLETKLEALEQHGMTLEDALQRLQEQERAAAGPPALVRDLWPAQRVLDAAIDAARSEKHDETLAALDRLDTLIAAVSGDLPASQIIVHCERALAYLSQDALDEAGAEMALAYRAADATRFATLVPEGVISLIQTNARSQISAGRRPEASELILTILRKCADHASLARMQRIDDAIAGARDAVQREAWPVVEAELFEAHRELTDLAESVRLDRWSLREAEPVEGPALGAEEPAEPGEAASDEEGDEGAGAEAEPGGAVRSPEPEETAASEAGPEPPRPRRRAR
jgi:hypothetical protein